LNINGNTSVVGIFGDPVEHTLSPAIQNAAFDALGINSVYVPFFVRSRHKGDIKAAVEAIRAFNMAGVNITIPYKERVIDYLDDLDRLARFIGAVNTVVHKKGKLKGYNTDASGFIRSLKEETGFVPSGKRVVILGAGGAARAILCAVMSAKPASIALANRTPKRAKALVEKFGGSVKGVELVASSMAAVPEHMESADILINATSMGMSGSPALDLPVDRLPGHAVVSDIVYRPLETRLIKAAGKAGLKTHKGLGMLIHQGALAFELWTGKKAPVREMKKAAMKALGLRYAGK